MKKNILLVLIFACFSLNSFTQVFIKLENGMSISSSSMKFDNGDVLNENVYSYSVLAGADYWEHPYFYLSSELGYVRTGVSEIYVMPLPESVPIKLRNHWNYIHANTTFRVRYPIKDFHFFAGIGPKVDFLIRSNNFKDDIFTENEYKMNKTNWGAKAELGFAKDFNRMRLGFNASYLRNFKEVGKNDYTQIKSNTYLLMLSFGWRFQ